MQVFEKLGAFYLGRRWDPEAAEITGETVLYDAKDLTTHGVCVGMTGSGKTGLCLSLIEEAALDGIPVIALDPKGDLGNLALTFPELRSEDFVPWIDPGEARRKGRTVEAHAERTAALWREGLAEWGQDGARIARLREAADLAIYTPGSSAGLGLSPLRSLAAPPPALRADADALRQRVASSVSGLLTLLGVDADPLRSREHILLSNLVEGAWREGRDLDLPGLIQSIQSPPVQRIGVMDLETFFPADDRFRLAMILNNLLASPGFAAWMEGEALDPARLLWTPEGKPRISVLSISHLSEAERMFFVTLLLQELLAWIRSQPGTSSLRAILYMDEIFGYFPPVANPPSKTPMLTLLKQARAYGLGVLLATQNPVDLDYKGLSNTGTWFLGRLQTERDKARVLDGLEGVSTATGAGFDRAGLDRVLSGLRSRVFLLHDVHETAPVLLHTRWAMSYLRGPLTTTQIRDLMAARKAAAPRSRPAGLRAGPAHGSELEAARGPADLPVLPPEVSQAYLAPSRPPRGGDRLLYRPALLGRARLHYTKARTDLDHWEEACLLAPLGEGSDPWGEASVLETEPRLAHEPDPRATFAHLPAEATKASSYEGWAKDLRDHLYRTRRLPLPVCKALDLSASPGETEGDFRIRLREAARERRDRELEKLRERWAARLRKLEDREERAEQKVDREASQYKQQKLQTAISLGATVLGALLGRKAVSSRSVGRATTTMRGMGRAARERDDIARAEERLESVREERERLEAAFEAELEEVREAWDPDSLEVDDRKITPRKSDLAVEEVRLAWVPWRVDPDGIAEPLLEGPI